MGDEDTAGLKEATERLEAAMATHAATSAEVTEAREAVQRAQGAMLVAVRGAMELTQEAFADRIGMSRATLAFAERGERPIGERHRTLIADGIGVGADRIDAYLTGRIRLVTLMREVMR